MRGRNIVKVKEQQSVDTGPILWVRLVCECNLYSKLYGMYFPYDAFLPFQYLNGFCAAHYKEVPVEFWYCTILCCLSVMFVSIAHACQQSWTDGPSGGSLEIIAIKWRASKSS